MKLQHNAYLDSNVFDGIGCDSSEQGPFVVAKTVRALSVTGGVTSKERNRNALKAAIIHK